MSGATDDERDPDQPQAAILEGCFLNGWEVLDLAVGVNAAGEVWITFQRDHGAEPPQLLILPIRAAKLFAKAIGTAIALTEQTEAALTNDHEDGGA
jgi:hypothetical protein